MTEYFTFDDVLILPNYSHFNSRKDVDISFSYKELSLPIPVVSSPMDTVTGLALALELVRLGGLPTLHRFQSVETQIVEFEAIQKECSHLEWFSPWSVAVAVGINDQQKVNAQSCYDAGVRHFCVDVAHGHSRGAGEMVKFLKALPDVYVTAGSVATVSGADYLVGCGADLIRTGIGASEVCTTRLKTGIGVPQLSAIMNCAAGTSKPVMADGGIKKPADACKALAGGAGLIMLGTMLAGADEAPGPVIDGFKSYRGMASAEVNQEHYGKLDEWKTAEGISKMIPATGPLKNTIQDITGGLRSALSYVGAKNLDEFRRKAQFIKVTSNTVIENNAKK